MASFNEICLLGNLGKDPVAVATKSGATICNFSVATKYAYKDANGQPQEEVSWHTVTLFGKRAEACIKYLKKGSAVFVVGRMHYRKFKDKSGNERLLAEVVAEQIRFLGGTRTAEERQQVQPQQAQQSATESLDEDCPF